MRPANSCGILGKGQLPTGPGGEIQSDEEKAVSLQDRFRIMTDFFARESIDYALVGAFAGDLELPVVSPEHLVMMKLFAVGNDPPRKFKELGDIREILLRQTVDLDSLRPHFQRVGLAEAFEEIRREITGQG
jgi:predicted nucleotidyltransferase